MAAAPSAFRFITELHGVPPHQRRGITPSVMRLRPRAFALIKSLRIERAWPALIGRGEWA